jgi:hypothetical protein
MPQNKFLLAMIGKYELPNKNFSIKKNAEKRMYENNSIYNSLKKKSNT